MSRINWNLLFSDENVLQALFDFGFNNMSANDVSDQLANTVYAGEFRRLVRTHGADYARNLTRKAMRYRSIEPV